MPITSISSTMSNLETNGTFLKIYVLEYQAAQHPFLLDPEAGCKWAFSLWLNEHKLCRGDTDMWVENIQIYTLKMGEKN